MFRNFYNSNSSSGSKFSEKYINYIIEHIIPTYREEQQKLIIKCFLYETTLTPQMIILITKLKTFSDWELLMEKANLPEDWIINNKEKINIVEILKTKQFTMEQLTLLSENQGINFWNNVMRYQNITEDFVIDNEENINIRYFSQRNPVSVMFINRYESQVDWTAILKRKNLDRIFLNSHKDKVFNFYFNEEVNNIQLQDEFDNLVSANLRYMTFKNTYNEKMLSDIPYPEYYGNRFFFDIGAERKHQKYTVSVTTMDSSAFSVFPNQSQHQ